MSALHNSVITGVDIHAPGGPTPPDPGPHPGPRCRPTRPSLPPRSPAARLPSVRGRTRRPPTSSPSTRFPERPLVPPRSRSPRWAARAGRCGGMRCAGARRASGGGPRHPPPSDAVSRGGGQYRRQVLGRPGGRRGGRGPGVARRRRPGVNHRRTVGPPPGAAYLDLDL